MFDVCVLYAQTLEIIKHDINCMFWQNDKIFLCLILISMFEFRAISTPSPTLKSNNYFKNLKSTDFLAKKTLTI